MANTARFQSLHSWDDGESPTHPLSGSMSSKPTLTTRHGFSHQLESFEEIVALSPNRCISIQDAPKVPRALSFRSLWGYGDTDGKSRRKQDRILDNPLNKPVHDPSHLASALDSRTDSMGSSADDKSALVVDSPQGADFVSFLPYKRFTLSGHRPRQQPSIDSSVTVVPQRGYAGPETC